MESSKDLGSLSLQISEPELLKALMHLVIIAKSLADVLI